MEQNRPFGEICIDSVWHSMLRLCGAVAMSLRSMGPEWFSNCTSCAMLVQCTCLRCTCIFRGQPVSMVVVGGLWCFILAIPGGIPLWGGGGRDGPLVVLLSCAGCIQVFVMPVDRAFGFRAASHCGGGGNGSLAVLLSCAGYMRVFVVCAGLCGVCG